MKLLLLSLTILISSCGSSDYSTPLSPNEETNNTANNETILLDTLFAPDTFYTGLIIPDSLEHEIPDSSQYETGLLFPDTTGINYIHETGKLLRNDSGELIFYAAGTYLLEGYTNTKIFFEPNIDYIVKGLILDKEIDGNKIMQVRTLSIEKYKNSEGIVPNTLLDETTLEFISQNGSAGIYNRIELKRGHVTHTKVTSYWVKDPISLTADAMPNNFDTTITSLEMCDEDYQELLNYMEESSFNNLNELYFDEKICGASTNTIAKTTNGISKIVTYNNTLIPQNVIKIETMIWNLIYKPSEVTLMK